MCIEYSALIGFHSRGLCRYSMILPSARRIVRQIHVSSRFRPAQSFGHLHLQLASTSSSAAVFMHSAATNFAAAWSFLVCLWKFLLAVGGGIFRIPHILTSDSLAPPLSCDARALQRLISPNFSCFDFTNFMANLEVTRVAGELESWTKAMSCYFLQYQTPSFAQCTNTASRQKGLKFAYRHYPIARTSSSSWSSLILLSLCCSPSSSTSDSSE